MKGPEDPGRSIAPFRVLRPAEPSPLIFAVAHAGRCYPGLDRQTIPGGPARLRSVEDPLVDRLVAPAVDAGAAVVIFDFARAWVDVNRDPREIDPLLLDRPAPTRARPSARTRAGLGVVPRLAADGRPLLDRRLTLAEIDARLEQAHRPYHAALETLLSEAHETFGVAVLTDWHSMPSAAAVAEQRRGGLRPDMVLGDRHGRACGAVWSGVVRAALEARGRRVVMNRPYAGGHVTERWGRPDAGVHALQVEIDRELYLDEATLEPLTAMARLQSDVMAVADALTARLGT